MAASRFCRGNQQTTIVGKKLTHKVPLTICSRQQLQILLLFQRINEKRNKLIKYKILFLSSSRTRVVCIKAIWFPATYTGCNGIGSGLGSNVERGFDGMGVLCVFCVYDTIGNRCFEKTSFPKTNKA